MIPKIITITGTSGTGKSSIAQILIEKYGLRYILSTTTRKPRFDDIIDSKNMYCDYEFISSKEFETLKFSGAFAWFKEFSLASYCTKKEYLDFAFASSSGLPKIMVLVPSAVVDLFNYASSNGYDTNLILPILINNPGEDVLRERMLKRGSDLSFVEKRMKVANTFDVSDSEIEYSNVDNLESELEETARHIADVLAGLKRI